MKRYVMALALVVASGAGLRAQASDRTVTVSGVVYQFSTMTYLPGAVVGVAEYPAVTTVSDASGRYTLTVPDDVEVTAYAVFPGFVTMHLQTFETAGEPIENAHFQLVPQQVFDFLAYMIGLPLDPGACQVATTVSLNEVRHLTWWGQVNFFPHGQEGATVQLSPAGGVGPIYFNSQVMPDASLSQTSDDGGVLILNLAPGRYRMIAAHPDHRFAKATLLCEPGRFINASPPWGLWAKQ